MKAAQVFILLDALGWSELLLPRELPVSFNKEVNTFGGVGSGVPSLQK